MGHDVKYYGKLTAKQPLNSQELELFKLLKKTEDYLYALNYELFVKETEHDTISITGHFTFNKDCEKIYPEPFYNAIEKYVKILKEGGNDLVDGSHLVSSSEYGIDEEAVLLLYTNGYFIKKKITELVSNYVMGIGSTKSKDLELKKEEKNDDFFTKEELFKSFYDITDEELNKFIQDVQSGKYK
jgi:hypothetical protein